MNETGLVGTRCDHQLIDAAKRLDPGIADRFGVFQAVRAAIDGHRFAADLDHFGENRIQLWKIARRQHQLAAERADARLEAQLAKAPRRGPKTGSSTD